ncbi:MAG: type II secretion system F family protein [Coriobacteriales bacterium]|nr:type II secretion system F family protein [Coriobacteriales bacterium]
MTPFGALGKRRADERQKASYERDLPALLEVVALGMQAGMGFDQAFALYAKRFDTPLARCCEESLAVWQKGLKSREEGMRQLADKVATPSFRHFASSALRALRFGAPMTQLLLDLAREARKEYRAKRQEVVAKAPVKMLLPTGALILPAMLLLVMGPIVLDLMRKMG